MLMGQGYTCTTLNTRRNHSKECHTPLPKTHHHVCIIWGQTTSSEGQTARLTQPLRNQRNHRQGTQDRTGCWANDTVRERLTPSVYRVSTPGWLRLCIQLITLNHHIVLVFCSLLWLHYLTLVATLAVLQQHRTWVHSYTPTCQWYCCWGLWTFG